MATDYVSAVAQALEDAFVGERTWTDPLAYGTFNGKRWDAKYGAYIVHNELIALRNARIVNAAYGQLSYACIAGLNVGDPVYISAASTATLALATTAAASKVIGFVRHKGTLGATSVGAATTCFLSHYYYKTGLSGLTVGDPVYLSDTGTISATQGTVPKAIGVAITTTTALLYADPVRDSSLVTLINGLFSLTGDISPAQIVANTDNYNPTGLSTASTLRLSTDASRNLTGIAGGSDGRLLIIHNIGSFNLVLMDDVTSTAANRFQLNADMTLLPDQSVLLQYDSTSSRWRVLGGGASFSDSEGDPANVTTAAADGTSNFAARRDHAHALADDVVTDAKLRESAGFSVIGKTATGTGNPADIVAADETVLGRTAAGNLVFAQVATGQLANDVVTYAKMQNISAASRILARRTAGAGDVEENTLSQILDFIGSAAWGDILFRGTAGWERLGAGTSGYFLQTSGAGVNPAWAAVGSLTILLMPGAYEPPAASYATLDLRNAHPVLDFDGATDEEAVWSGIAPNFTAGATLTLDTFWAFTSATSGSLRVQAALERIDASSLDIDADSFAAFNSSGGTAPGTSGQVIKVTVSFATGAEQDNLAANEAFRLKIRRDADGTSGTDDITTDAELIAARLSWG